MKESIKIYTFYYKETTIPVEDRLYRPVMAGNVLRPNLTGMTGDDTGSSISEKNRRYSELTGIYWVWKNTRQDITGSCHYRRYFTAKGEPFDLKIKRWAGFFAGLYRKRYGLIYTNNFNRFGKRVLNSTETEAILREYDAILPQKRKLNHTVEKHYERYHNKTDLKVIEAVIADKYPAYLPAFREVLHGKRLYANNMFVLPDAHFSRFMEWWFSILFEVERRLTLENYQGYQQRIMGFIGERLLTVWFCHEKLRVKELPVIYFKRIKGKDK